MKELRARRSDCGSFIIDRLGTILGFDEQLEKLTGWAAVDVVGRGRSLDLAPDPKDRRVRTVPLFDGEIPMVRAERGVELALHTHDGRRLEIEALARPLPGPGQRVQVTVLRVLSRSAYVGTDRGHERLDELTGLPDQDAFLSRLADEMWLASASARPLALILADVDHLRDINDRLGREAGDQVLRKLAGILRVTTEQEGLIARLGDDDLAILLPNSGRGEARQYAASLRSTVERFRFFPGKHDDLRVTLSLGAASYPADAESEADLLDRSREALDEARSLGRNRVWCYLRRPRVPLEVPVFFDGAEQLLVGYTRDMSPSGIFVQTATPIDIGMRCALAFPVPGYDGRVHVIGRVVRTVPPTVPEAAAEIRIPGMGVEFERFGGTNDRRAIDSFVHGREATSLRPENGRFSVPGDGPVS